jgi:hypothetical protein
LCLGVLADGLVGRPMHLLAFRGLITYTIHQFVGSDVGEKGKNSRSNL